MNRGISPLRSPKPDTAAAILEAVAAGAVGFVATRHAVAAPIFALATVREPCRTSVRALTDLTAPTQRFALAALCVALLGAPLSNTAAAAAVAVAAGVLCRLIASVHSRRSVLKLGGEPVVLVGEEADVSRVGQLLARHPEHGMRPVATATPGGGPVTVLPSGTVGDLPDLLVRYRGPHVLLASPSMGPQLEAVLGRSRPGGTRISVVPPAAELLTTDFEVIDVRGLPLLTLGPRRTPQGPLWWAKRAIDYAATGVGLLFLAPVLALIALAIKLDSSGPVFFRQTRIGRDGQPFRMWKFRSMVRDAEARQNELTDLSEATFPFFKMEADPRVTRVGRVLRKYCLDELPQLFNVLAGDMSLVGPRPCLASEVAARPEMFDWRLDFLPGITGPWQVAGRSWLPADEGMRMDLAYIEHWSPAYDLRLVLQTFVVAIRGTRKPSVVAPSDRVSLDRNRYLRMVNGDDLLPSEHPSEVSVVIVTHESAADIDGCLESLECLTVPHEIIVVDNASNDGTTEVVRSKHPNVRLITKKERHGFATNSNIGAVAANGSTLLFLNPDVRVHPGAVERLLSALRADPSAGAVGARLLYPDGTPQPSARRFPRVWPTVVRRTPLRWILRSSAAERQHLRLDEPVTGNAPVLVDWMLGAALALPADLFGEMGGFDDGYRLYCEDIDLCWRVHAVGRRVMYVPGAEMVHALGETTRHRFLTRLTWWHFRSMARYVRLHGLRRPPALASQPAPARNLGSPHLVEVPAV